MSSWEWGVPQRSRAQPSRSLQTDPAGLPGCRPGVETPVSPSPSVSPACHRLLEQVVSCGGLLPGAGLPEEQTITWFQFHSYLRRQSVSDLEKHFAQLTKEGRGWGGGPAPRVGDSPSRSPLSQLCEARFSECLSPPAVRELDLITLPVDST